MRALSNGPAVEATLKRTWLGSVALALLGAAATLSVPRDAHAQSGSVQKPMPNVLLLVDTSGSMERMPDNSLPADNRDVVPGGLPNACNPGSESNPNRWGMLLQALTGNMQPYYSCAAVDRSAGSGTAFRNEYKINGVRPYDTDYFMPYHRPLAGAGTNACAIGPHRLPGAADGSGVGPNSLGFAKPAGQGGDVRDFPDDALITAKWTYVKNRYGSNLGLDPVGSSDSCSFDQAPDGQLDAARDYVRFALMTFDNDEGAEIGVNGGVWPPQNQVQTGGQLPFLGQWSYRRDPSNPDYGLGSLIPGAADGLPGLCAPPRLGFEVGSRHYGAPPWEGRMVPFPAEDASLLDIQRVNEQIQKVLLASRPYGATPIDGMMDDARDYFWYNAKGPKTDDYVATANCREQYIVLLTDGAPNLNLRPSCQGPGGICPFPSTAAQTAAALRADASRRVTTFVIGFSVNGASSRGDGFPTGYGAGSGKNNCKAWYAGVGGTPQKMAAACSATPPPSGSNAEACCELNRIAYEGSGGAGAGLAAVGPFFAESQADIVLAFGKILASITKSVSTRTVPTFTPAAYSAAGFGVGATTAQYIGSFIPNAQKPWSGEIRRDRSVCDNSSGAFGPSQAPPSLAAGDSMAVNLATQSAANRLFFTALPEKYTAAPGSGFTDVIDAAGTVRPFKPTNTDGIPVYRATEQSGTDWNLRTAADIKLALEIDKTTCKRGRAVDTVGTGTKLVPALDQDTGDACTRVVLGFATGHVGAITETGTVTGGKTASYDFNIRCTSASGSPSAGHCSISNDACDVAATNPCPTLPGEVCVPDCAPLGAIFRANPVVNGPPDGLLRDSGYRAFQARRSKRKPTLFAATTDGILHAFKAIETAPNAHHELWSFIPPAVLPRLASNYPSGNQILLDGTPVVKDTVWERAATDLDGSGGASPGAKWHTTLVAGLGVSGGGYYAVNVTDSDCDAGKLNPGSTTGECLPGGAKGYESPSPYNLDEAGAGDYDAATPPKRGPHFLWQLTDLPKATDDKAPVVRRTRDGKERVSLFGRTTGTPAITTLQISTPTGERQVGVAILPGGIDGQPVAGASCPRKSSSGSGDRVNDPARPPRDYVRQWATDCTLPVPGRSVTIVRLDTGEILRHFARRDDVPKSLPSGVVADAPFDSPMVGTPVVYPQAIGAVGQKIFIGDADGTLWRIDVSSSDPSKWKAALFADLVLGSNASDSQPIQVAPVLSLEPGGALVVNAATGDQESFVYHVGEKNYVWSILEQRPTGTEPPKALTKWVETLDNGERVTGPMTVFDRTLYFATFAPKIPARNQCENAGVARLWGLNYFVAEGTGSLPGGLPMWCTNVLASGVCTGTSLVKSEAITDPEIAGYVIPGVTLRPTQACSEIGNIDEGAGLTGFSTLTPSQFQLSYAVPKPANAAATGFPPTAMTKSMQRPMPRVSTTVNAWALVVD